MKFVSPLLVVKDIEESKKFYHEVLGLEVTLDFGENVTLTGGISLQSEKTWKTLINSNQIYYHGQDSEIYFEEKSFDKFIKRLQNMENIKYVHPVIEHPWGQRVVRIYDLDNHIIEIGETLESVINKFYKNGLSDDEIAKRMDVPLGFVSKVLSDKRN